ncbi:MAG: hypothetical protein ACRD1D_05905 [Acidimicrobiales bacterium]
MVQPQRSDTLTGVVPKVSRVRRRITRVIAAGAIVAGTLAVAGPSWAIPQMGC